MIDLLKTRFENNPGRHSGVTWEEVEKVLRRHPDAICGIEAMEETGGEPDVIGRMPDKGAILVCDFSRESPSGRRSLCYDDEALARRRRNPPKGSALAQAERMGIELMDREQYRYLQTLDEFDLKTSSWVATPPDVRGLGGALFCERRYGRVFTYHNGADSYYAVRGWRGVLRLPV